MARKNLTARLLRELLHYDLKTGVFTWIKRRPRIHVGMIAGCTMKKGYRRIVVNNSGYQAHRLAWLYMTGKWPLDEIDHFDCDKANNRFANLREIPKNCQQQNQRLPHKGSATGFLGVTHTEKSLKPYRASIRVNGRLHYLGDFVTPENAHTVYLKAKRRLHKFGTL
jgi:hypothetical protein